MWFSKANIYLINEETKFLKVFSDHKIGPSQVSQTILTNKLTMSQYQSVPQFAVKKVSDWAEGSPQIHRIQLL